MLMARALNTSGLAVEAVVISGGFPKDSSVLDGVDTIVVYADGGGRHPLNAHIDDFRKRMSTVQGPQDARLAQQKPAPKVK